MLNATILKRICPRIMPQILANLPQSLDYLAEEFEITQGSRLEHFLAQLAHESDGFSTMREYASGKAYEGRKDLGNVHPGDGVKYVGRGLIMITGYFNYKSYGKQLGLDLLTHPELAEDFDNALAIAGCYWENNHLNKEADAGNIITITRRINGGLNGLASRKQYFQRFKDAGV